jgi:hypothetical protein
MRTESIFPAGESFSSITNVPLRPEVRAALGYFRFLKIAISQSEVSIVLVSWALMWDKLIKMRSREIDKRRFIDNYNFDLSYPSWKGIQNLIQKIRI